jgi:hypothetical protein
LASNEKSLRSVRKSNSSRHLEGNRSQQPGSFSLALRGLRLSFPEHGSLRTGIGTDRRLTAAARDGMRFGAVIPGDIDKVQYRTVTATIGDRWRGSNPPLPVPICGPLNVLSANTYIR